jgi:AraC family transcriptional activator of tynA and feaB
MSRSVLLTTSVGPAGGVDPLDAWNAACVEALVGDAVWPTGPGGRSQFRGTLSQRWIDDLLYVEFDSSGFGANYRPRSRANEYVGFGFSPATYGETVRLRDDRTVDLWARSYTWDNSRIKEYRQIGRGQSSVLYVPRTAIRDLGGRTDIGALVVQDGCVASRLLQVLVDALRHEREPMEASAAVCTRNALLELVLAVLRRRGPGSTATAKAAMRESVERWIETNLALGGVTPARAAAVHRISVRSLFRLFEDSGESFAATVRSRRVASARRDLLTGHEPIGVIAARWGFADASHFVREFRRAYGQTPRECREESRRPAS